jgi:hypothetical protein
LREVGTRSSLMRDQISRTYIAERLAVGNRAATAKTRLIVAPGNSRRRRLDAIALPSPPDD